MAEGGQTGEMGLEEAAEEGFADDGAVLGPEIVADEEDVDDAGRRLEDVQAHLEVIVDQTPEQDVDDGRALDHARP